MVNHITNLKHITSGLQSVLDHTLEVNGGLLRLAPCWVPRSFMHPGRRLKLHPDDLYAFGLHRGGINERWFGSTTEAQNEGRVVDEGLSYVVTGKEKFQLKEVIRECGEQIIGARLWNKYQKWPVYSKFFDNMGPIPHHLHQNDEQAALVGQEGKPESYYFPPQQNQVFNNFPYTFMGIEPGVTKEQVRKCLENWNKGDNGILSLSRAYRLDPGTGWKIDTGILHAPGSLCTYEPQWGSDVFGMYQNIVEGREVGWDLLVKDMPKDKHQDLDFIISQLDWEKNTDPHFMENHHLNPILDTESEDHQDKWVCYGTFDSKQPFTAKELTINPGSKVTIKDKGAYGLITVQGKGKMNKLNLSSPQLIRFQELTEDEVFCTEQAAMEGVTFENTSETEPLVMLRYFGPDTNPNAPDLKGE